MTDGAAFREATAADAPAIAALHADSWRRHYRHSYPDSFFGPALDDDRLAVWSERLAASDGTATVVAVAANELIGFVHVVLDADPEWGALVDNLHVRHDMQRHGIATQLMGQAASFVAASAPTSGIYLWVLERNDRAQAFYRTIGGAVADQRAVDAPALPDTLCLRIVWPEPSDVRDA